MKSGGGDKPPKEMKSGENNYLKEQKNSNFGSCLFKIFNKFVSLKTKTSPTLALYIKSERINQMPKLDLF